jgi:hypothetical protein
MAATVQILKVGHALVQGARGEKGGAPSKDSLFGVAQITQGVVSSLVTFGGRRGGFLRFKTYPKASADAVMAKFDAKLVKAQGGFNYTDVTANAAELLGADFADKLLVNFRAASNAKKVNTRATAKKAKVGTTRANTGL